MNKYELEILEAVGGRREWPQWGAWVGVSLSWLWENGYITGETDPELTQKGRQVLGLTH